MKYDAQMILEEVADHQGVSVRDIVGRSRKREIFRARCLAAGVMWKEGMTQECIGEHLGNRNHSAIGNALKSVDNDTFPGIEDEVHEVLRSLATYQSMRWRHLQLSYGRNQDLAGMYEMTMA